MNYLFLIKNYLSFLKQAPSFARAIRHEVELEQYTGIKEFEN